MRCLAVFCVLALVLGRNGANANADDAQTEAPPVRFEINHGDGVYHEKDLIRVRIESDVDTYVYVFYHQASGDVAMMLPNGFRDGNRIVAGGSLVIGAQEGSAADGMQIEFQATAPGGDETIQVLSSPKPLAAFEEIRAHAGRGIATIPMPEFQRLSQEHIERHEVLVNDSLSIKNLSVGRAAGAK